VKPDPERWPKINAKEVSDHARLANHFFLSALELAAGKRVSGVKSRADSASEVSWLDFSGFRNWKQVEFWAEI
jgi:hypothetical protein